MNNIIDSKTEMELFVFSDNADDEYEERQLECYIEQFLSEGKICYRLKDRNTGKRVVFDFENRNFDFFDFRDKLMAAFCDADDDMIGEMEKKDGQWWIFISGPIKYENKNMIAIDGVPYNLSFKNDFFFLDEFEEEENSFNS